MKADRVLVTNKTELLKEFETRLLQKGQVGRVAVCLFRATRASLEAQRYTFRKRKQILKKKDWSIEQVALALMQNPQLGITFGWLLDQRYMLNGNPTWAIYVDLPQGQVAFHSPVRYEGPDYPGVYDGTKLTIDRVTDFCDRTMERISTEK